MAIYTFNFNPETENVPSFISNVIKKLSGNKLPELTNKQKAIEVISKNLDTIAEDKRQTKKKEIATLKKDLILQALEIKEKLRFTFNGFEPNKKTIPSELIKGSERIIENHILNLLCQCYFTAQIYSIFKLTDAEFNTLSVKGKKGRNKKEQSKYTKVLDLISEIDSFIKLLKRNSDKDENESEKQKINQLEKIKNMGKEGKKMYDLLKPLLFFNENDLNYCQQSTMCRWFSFFSCAQEITSDKHALVQKKQSK